MKTKEETTSTYPLLARIYGILCLIGGGVQVISIVLLVLVLVAAIAVGFDFSSIKASGELSVTTLVLIIVSFLLSALLSVAFFVLGIRLLRGKRHKVALQANVMIAVELAALACHFMLNGLNTELIPPSINIIILIALETYSDPALRDERQLQRHLQALEWKSDAEDGVLGRDKTGKGYITLNFYNIFWVFVVCCVLGLVIEIIWHMTVVDPGVYQDRAGLLYGPFSPIYGVGAVLVTAALNRFHNKNPLVVFFVAGFIGAAFEFFVSWFFETSFGIKAWDYTGTFLSIDGRTNFMFFCMWGLLGLVWLRYLLPIMLKIVNLIPWNWRYAATSVAAALMIANCVLTMASFDCWFQRAKGTVPEENQSALVAFCNKNYDDEFMQHRFQSMTITPESSSRVNQ